jgi:hypothetical protein
MEGGFRIGWFRVGLDIIKVSVSPDTNSPVHRLLDALSQS